MENKPESTQKGNWKLPTAVIISFVSLLVSLLTFYLNFLSQGKLVIHEPTGYCIVRGYTNLGFESDFLVIPFIAENTGKGAKVLGQPVLSLHEQNNIHPPITYRMTGMIPDLYRETMDKPYEIGFGINIPEKSVTQYQLVFHIENWWDVTKPDYFKFHFTEGEQWEASLSYTYNNKNIVWENGKKPFFTMPIPGTINKLEYGSNYNSDCFSLVRN